LIQAEWKNFFYKASPQSPWKSFRKERKKASKDKFLTGEWRDEIPPQSPKYSSKKVIGHKRVRKKKNSPPQSPIDFFKEIQKRNSSKFYRPHPTGEWKT
jgi:hypothetical protein